MTQIQVRPEWVKYPEVPNRAFLMQGAVCLASIDKLNHMRGVRSGEGRFMAKTMLHGAKTKDHIKTLDEAIARVQEQISEYFDRLNVGLVFVVPTKIPFSLGHGAQ